MMYRIEDARSNSRRILNKLYMIRSKYNNKALLCVEGKNDKKIFNNFIDEKMCEINYCGNKEYVINCIKLFNQKNIHGVLGIVDCDYERLNNSIQSIPNIIYTSENDMELEMIKCNEVYQKLLCEYADFEKMNEFQLQNNIDVLTVITKIASEVGLIRYWSFKCKKEIDFKNDKITDYIRDNKFIVNGYIKLLLAGRTESRDIENITKAINDIRKNTSDIWMLCRGHDVTNILSFMLSNKDKSPFLGNQNNINQSMIESALRLSYTIKQFSCSVIYERIILWQERNGYGILKDH